MTTFAWCTDIHLDFIDDDRLIAFGEGIANGGFDGVLISGDISVASELIYHLSAFERIVHKPTYFVLGNHDYYGSNVQTVRTKMKDLSNMSSYLRYLQTTPYVKLSPSTALVGHDGWYDALNGNADGSRFVMTDWFKIQDFIQHTYIDTGMYGSERKIKKPEIIKLAQQLAHEGVEHVAKGIKAAAPQHKNIIIMTHFPPFKESHWHQGKIGDDHAQPWYTSKMMGDMLLQASKSYPNHTFTVLCGHTHGKHSSKVTNNLTVHVGGADYGHPSVQMPVLIPDA